jgi:histidine phosphotransferase ChpT
MTHNTTTTTPLPEMQDIASPVRDNSMSDLSVFLVARLCHDLASPLGAIGNGVELLEMMAQSDGPELQMVSTSVRQATARLRLFRFAFGPAQSDQMTGVSEMRALLKAHDETARFWTEYAIPHDIPRSHAKMLLLGLMCVETALAWGGNVRISSVADGYDLRVIAERFRIDPPLWAMLDQSGPESVPTAATIHFPLFKRVATEQGFALSCAQDAAAMAIVLRPVVGPL